MLIKSFDEVLSLDLLTEDVNKIDSEFEDYILMEPHSVIRTKVDSIPVERAMSLGFENVAFFNRFFKRVTASFL